MLSSPGLPHRTTPMTPDKSVHWTVHDVPHLDSTLYLRPSVGALEEPTAEDLDKMLVLAEHGAEATQDAEKINEGAYGTVYRMGNLAVKRAHYINEHDEQVGLGATQAMVSLDEGLRRLSSSKITAPTPYAVIVPGPGAPNSVRSTVLMSYATGSAASGRNIGLPDARKRQQIYDAAMQKVGAEPGDIHYDDSMDNLIVQRRYGIVRSATKLDVVPQPSFVKKMGREPTQPYTDPDWS